ncbi:MAG TPA: NAD(P)H-hydrate epimerase [Nitrolancea sp.]|nr:NAD(P)H-hydrate epimerase [Nitrolancea sp.]
MNYPVITIAQMMELDRITMSEAGVSLLQMMENAGRSLAAVARYHLGGDLAGVRILVLTGKGNNGGGGLAAARHLANGGAAITLGLSVSPDALIEAPTRQLQILAAMGVPGHDQPVSLTDAPRQIAEADLIIDALIGYRLHGSPRPPIAELIQMVNASQVDCLSLDGPSGLDLETGNALTPTIRAAATLTLAWPKRGLLESSAASFTGPLWLADIGIPDWVYEAVGIERGTLFRHGPIVRVTPTDDGWETDQATGLDLY